LAGYLLEPPPAHRFHRGPAGAAAGCERARCGARAMRVVLLGPQQHPFSTSFPAWVLHLAFATEEARRCESRVAAAGATGFKAHAVGDVLWLCLARGGLLGGRMKHSAKKRRNFLKRPYSGSDLLFTVPICPAAIRRHVQSFCFIESDPEGERGIC
jgi:hypothetical protein